MTEQKIIWALLKIVRLIVDETIPWFTRQSLVTHSSINVIASITECCNTKVLINIVPLIYRAWICITIRSGILGATIYSCMFMCPYHYIYNMCAGSVCHPSDMWQMFVLCIYVCGSRLPISPRDLTILRSHYNETVTIWHSNLYLSMNINSDPINNTHTHTSTPTYTHGLFAYRWVISFFPWCCRTVLLYSVMLTNI